MSHQRDRPRVGPTDASLGQQRMLMDVVFVPVLEDNYSYLIADSDTGDAAIVDCAVADPVLAAIKKHGVRLTTILSTHHHWDHTGGNEDLVARTGTALRVYGYGKDRARLPCLTDELGHGDSLQVGRLQARALFVPAHTSGHLAYYFPEQGAVFTGDTLFAAGCGRLFEGDAAQMMSSLSVLSALPDDTRVYCGHEYTENNLRFAATLEPSNGALKERIAAVAKLRRDGKPSLPSTIGLEKATNPFLRVDAPELRMSLRTRFPDLADEPTAVFAAARALKDSF